MKLTTSLWVATCTLLVWQAAHGQSRECVVNGNRINCQDTHVPGSGMRGITMEENPASIITGNAVLPTREDTFLPAVRQAEEDAHRQEIMEMERQRWQMEQRIRSEQLRQLQIQNNAADGRSNKGVR